MSQSVASNIDPMKEFQDKLKQRVRDDIRDLLPDDAVAGLIKKAVEDMFFTPRIETEPGWNGRTVQKPSWFVEAVSVAAKPIIEAAVKRVVDEHPAEVSMVIAEFLDSNKLTVQTTSILTSMLSGAIHDLIVQLQRSR